MKKLVIYTCITGGYDNLYLPEVLCPDADWICLCDDVSLFDGTEGIWQLRSLDCPIKGLNSIQRARFAKTNPHLYFPDYEYSLWIDGNIKIVSNSFWDIISEKIESGVQFSTMCHLTRDCAYDEALVCLAAGKASFKPLFKAVRYLSSKGFPRHSGLCESNVILRAHNTKLVRALDEKWSELILKVCHRDQLSLPYCLWESGLEMDCLLPKGINARNSEMFEYNPVHKVSRVDEKRDSFLVWFKKGLLYNALELYIKLATR